MDLDEIFNSAHGVASEPSPQPVISPTQEPPSLFSSPLRALTSADWWLTRPSGERISAGEAVTAPAKLGLLALNSALLGKLPHALAPLDAAYEEVKDLFGVGAGRSIGENLSESVRRSQATLADLKTEMPVVGTAAEIGGGFFSPINKLGLVRRAYQMGGLAGIASRAGVAAATGAAYELGSEDQDLGEAVTDSVIASTLLDAGSAALGKVGKLAGRTLKSQLGLTRQSYITAAKGMSKRELAKAESSLDRGFDLLQKENPLTLKDLAQDRQGALTAMAGNLESLIDKRTAQVNGLIDVLDGWFKPEKSIRVITKNGDRIRRQFAESQVAERDKFIREYNALRRAWWESTKDKKVTLRTLQNEKMRLNKSYNIDPAALDAKKAWTDDVRGTIDNFIEGLVKDGKLEKEGSDIIQVLNRESRDLISVRDAVLRKLPSALGESQTEAARRAFNTTGGAGGGVAGQLGDAIAGDAGKAAAILGTIGTFAGPVARPLAAITEKAAPAAAGVLAAPEARTGLFALSRGIDPASSQVEAPARSSPNLNLDALFDSAHGKQEQTANATSSPINSDLLDAVKYVESRGNKNAVSPKGAKGAYQFMPATAKAYGVDLYDDDDTDDREGAKNLLSDEFQALGSMELALASYNAGRPKVLKAIQKAGSTEWSEVKKHLPDETQKYIPLIAQALKRMRTTA